MTIRSMSGMKMTNNDDLSKYFCLFQILFDVAESHQRWCYVKQKVCGFCESIIRWNGGAGATNTCS